MSPHFNKNKGENIPQRDGTDELYNENAIIPNLLANGCKIFEYGHPRYMFSQQHDLVIEVLNGRKQKLIQENGTQNFSYEDILESLLFLDNQKHYDALKLLCDCIIQEYSEHSENAVFLRNGGIRYCLYGLPCDLTLQYVRLDRPNLLELFIRAEISSGVTPQQAGRYYQCALIELCNNVLKYETDYELKKLEFMLEVLGRLNIDGCSEIVNKKYFGICDIETLSAKFNRSALLESFMSAEISQKKDINHYQTAVIELCDEAIKGQEDTKKFNAIDLMLNVLRKNGIYSDFIDLNRFPKMRIVSFIRLF